MQESSVRSRPQQHDKEGSTVRVDADWSLDERRYQHVVARAIGSRLKEERRRLGVTLDESAEAAGI
jgi:hypothetical protein